MLDQCPACGYVFEKEDGYWVTAMIINTAVTEAVFGILFVAAIVASWPEVHWIQLLVIGAVTNVVVPVLFYPLSKTIWVAIDLSFHPISPTPERPSG
jgi:uncharacterized membrane protein YagU involved in acid resistance